jgi:ACS family hexuronate transporter-like MFS transporter
MIANKQSHFRWFILGLLFVATTILYIDRSALGILAPHLQKEIGWTEQQYGIINSVFMVAYAICFLVMGKLIDRMGTRKGYLLSISIWSIAALAHALARTWVGFAFSRFALAIGQSGNFPSAIKAVAEWFPKKERALAVGIFNGGSNMGTMLAPLIIPVLVLSMDNWRIGFLWTFPISLIWAIVWFRSYRKPENHHKVSELELVHIQSDNVEESTSLKLGWKDILTHRQTWAIALAKFIADPIWWFYLFWGAKFLYAKFGINLREIGVPFFTIYGISWILGIFLGWLSSRFLKMGWGINKGRKLSMLICGVLAIPVVLVPHTDHFWLAVGLIALAAGAHCGWSANVFSLMSDVFPKMATASIAGFGGFAGAVGGALAAYGVGHILQNSGPAGYIIPFALSGCGYLFALLGIQLLVPRIKMIEIGQNERKRENINRA